MPTEQQKYLSGIFRTVGFALLTPAATTIFKWFVFEEGTYFGHFLEAVTISSIGLVLLVGGYTHLEEKR